VSLRAVIKLLFSEEAFLQAELEHVEKMRAAGKPYLPADEFAPEARSRIQNKRRNLCRSFSWISSLVIAGALTGVLLNNYWPQSWFLVRVTRAISIALLAWAVWSKLGDIESMKKETLVELAGQSLYKTLYSLGLFLGSVALFLEGTGGA
jgi:hypothetical protein